jgi:cytochrome oxidase assembly protein ShyY1
VYRFLVTPKWVGFAALMITMSAVMVGLGDWQLHRYEERHAINLRISEAKAAAPVPMDTVMGSGRPIPSDDEWVRVTVSGTYAPGKTIIARDRTISNGVGFEIVTPLVLADGSAVLIDRGWIPVGSNGSTQPPIIPPVATGTVTITGRVHLPESEPDTPIRLGGNLAVRRIAPATIAANLGYPALLPDYILLDQQKPTATGGFTKIPADTQPSWMNAGYTVQWWCFALLALFGFGWAARREATDRRDGVVRTSAGRQTRSRDRLADDLDRVPPTDASLDESHPADIVGAGAATAGRASSDTGS